jgi:chaperonin GroES
MTAAIGSEVLTPLFDRVVIVPQAAKTETDAGVLIPDAAQEKPSQGVVLSVGDDAAVLKPGDRVLYARYTGAEVELNGETVLIIKEREVLGRLTTQVTVHP